MQGETEIQNSCLLIHKKDKKWGKKQKENKRNNKSKQQNNTKSGTNYVTNTGALNEILQQTKNLSKHEYLEVKTILSLENYY